MPLERPPGTSEYLGSLTLRVAIAARSREEAEGAFRGLVAPLDPVEAVERTVFVSARPDYRALRGDPRPVGVAVLPNGDVRVARPPREKRLRG